MKSNLDKHIFFINWELLRDQKLRCAEIVAESKDISEDQRDALDGILNLIDSFQEAIINDNIRTEEEVCGPEGIPDRTETTVFTHSELKSDFAALLFPKIDSYLLGVHGSGKGDKSFDFGINFASSGDAFFYNYATKEEARKDMTTFKQKLGIAE